MNPRQPLEVIKHAFTTEDIRKLNIEALEAASLEVQNLMSAAERENLAIMISVLKYSAAISEGTIDDCKNEQVKALEKELIEKLKIRQNTDRLNLAKAQLNCISLVTDDNKKPLNLAGAVLIGASFEDAGFKNVNLDAADFSQARLSSAIFEECSAKETKFSDALLSVKGSMCNFKMDLSKAIFLSEQAFSSTYDLKMKLNDLYQQVHHQKLRGCESLESVEEKIKCAVANHIVMKGIQPKEIMNTSFFASSFLHKSMNRLCMFFNSKKLFSPSESQKILQNGYKYK